MIPSVETLLKQTEKSMKAYSIVAVHYGDTVGPTFEFASGDRSPPLGSYSQKANIHVNISRGLFISKASFGIHD